MESPTLARRFLWVVAAVLMLAGTLAAAVWLSRPEEWSPPLLAAMLLGLAFLGEWFSVEHHDGVLSAALVTIVMAMALLGPAPAAACGAAAGFTTSAVRRLPPGQWLGNLSTFAAVPFVGGLMVRALAGDVHDPRNHHLTQSVLFGLIVLGVFIVANGLNFLLVGLGMHIKEGRSLGRQVREYVPLLSGELATGALAVILVVAYTNLGLPVLFGSIALLLIFRHLTVALLRSEERAEQLEARTRQLSSFQWGVPSMFMEGLGLRDPTALRHAAAVASYAKAMAIELGCDEEEQELIHLTGLLHDIGKFTWSDRVLHPEQLTDEDWTVIRRHPQDGAMMVGKLDGFGLIAEAILYHHERVDGGGYPAGLIGNEIPLASRIVAICTTYDSMTKRETYGPPMSPQEAMAELCNVAGRQLDAELVETFISLLERRGPAFGQEADYKTELAFGGRVRKMAEPRQTKPTQAQRSARPQPRREQWRSGVHSLRQRALNKD